LSGVNSILPDVALYELMANMSVSSLNVIVLFSGSVAVMNLENSDASYMVSFATGSIDGGLLSAIVRFIATVVFDWLSPAVMSIMYIPLLASSGVNDMRPPALILKRVELS